MTQQVRRNRRLRMSVLAAIGALLLNAPSAQAGSTGCATEWYCVGSCSLGWQWYCDGTSGSCRLSGGETFCDNSQCYVFFDDLIRCDYGGGTEE